MQPPIAITEVINVVFLLLVQWCFSASPKRASYIGHVFHYQQNKKKKKKSNNKITKRHCHYCCCCLLVRVCDSSVVNNIACSLIGALLLFIHCQLQRSSGTGRLGKFQSQLILENKFEGNHWSNCKALSSC
ncbi:unnamed protein product [Ceratitis capitata]|uniref:(Mediterranean fruit fly) hypothetical protein n=1 Tax=Ceratitis capitata TaxID=7213 RepID=A0A811V7H2_CERCA|nr:unnamed protein product [Ceratitis capitata]